jgi:hypothetical protein
MKLSKKRTTTIDAIVSAQRLPRLDFIKMNIEGAELNAIDSARQSLLRFKPSLVITADHTVNDQLTCFEVEERLRQLDYTVERVTIGDAIIVYAFAV